MAINELIFDVETTIKNKGNPYDKDNKVCYWGYFDSGGIDIRVSPRPDLTSATCILFNGKFDLAWAKRYNVILPSTIWDCQLASFLLVGQTTPYPSLDGVASSYGLGAKLSVVDLEYWSKGIDTPDIPEQVMREYLEQDLRLTYKVYKKQKEEFNKNPQLFKLFQLQCEDLLTLLEMEWNGLVLDVETCKQKEKECEKEIEDIDKELKKIVGDIPVNFASNDHLSAILYGGTIVHKSRVPVGVYKTGEKAGQPRYKVIEYEFKQNGFFKPPKGSELAKPGYYSTDQDTLQSLNGSGTGKLLLRCLLDRSRQEKLLGTYFRGFPEKLQKSNSIDGRLHCQFNQVVARTGRLSSSNPNLQNLDKEMKRLMVSRYNV